MDESTIDNFFENLITDQTEKKIIKKISKDLEPDEALAQLINELNQVN